MSKRAGVILGLIVAAVVAVAVIPISILLVGGHEEPPASKPTPTEPDVPAPTSTPRGPAENDEWYGGGSYQTVDVFLVDEALPVDDAPHERGIGLSATPASADGAPVFADPEEEPVAWLPQEQRYGGTVVPVVEEHEHWVKVLLVGRQARAGDGDPGQLSGWLRKADIELAEQDNSVEVDLEAHTIDIVTGTGDDASRETVSTDFAWGTEATPTPMGRSFVMLTEVTSFDYTRGHPIVYLSVQSPTLATFGGDDVAITAFHYHDLHSGDISNGCLRVDADAIEKLADLPEGTPVYIE